MGRDVSAKYSNYRKGDVAVTILQCDRCGKQHSEKENNDDITKFDISKLTAEMGKRVYYCDLCGNCTDTIVSLVMREVEGYTNEAVKMRMP